ncbi:hypothetical protein FPQ18DRAFT_273303 [Pyronema domesticum]|uniref:Similar to Histone-fold domain-containing protein new1 acc. no. G2TRL2 n=1 Tax=Pyronema omphalodes (strain CBS 100304) TaxID=1076935 RepID=U4L2N8_PYROM|nr:hypothetical protein FPQ18DRAFT_273303 [Pyronema domesticum]CCX06508.1 Similar to Histone-fold domain-containing protein new1; acc. no. G2TRL2 [Pyronema omphalodes CBS 100304]
MVARSPYPRSVVKRTIKAHTGLNVSKNVDILLYLDYVLFMQELMRQANVQARKRGSATISPADLKKVSRDTLQKFKV